MAFTLASRVSALGEAEIVRFVYVPSLAKTYFIYTIKVGNNSRQFYARELPAVASLVPSAFPLPGAELALGEQIASVVSFNVIALSTPDQIVVLYSDGAYVWRFKYDFGVQGIVEVPTQLFEGNSPVLANVINGILSAYLRDEEIKARFNFGPEAALYVPSATLVPSFSVTTKSAYSLNYAGAHLPAPTTALKFSADANTILAYVMDDSPASIPYYDDQNLSVGAVSIAPSVLSEDPDNKPLIYSTIGSLPSSLTIDAATGVISGTLDSVDLTKGAVTVSVSDGLLSVNSDTMWLFGQHATGGWRSIYTDSGRRYRTHSFYQTGTFYVYESMLVDYLVVGGGGGGGMDMGGGGGGGGVVTGSQILAPGVYQMLVGPGGLGAPAADTKRADGAGPQPSSHQYTIPAMNGAPSAAFCEVPDDAYLSLLLNMNGANNGTTFNDLSPYKNTLSVFGNVKTSTAQSKFGGSSAAFDGSGDYLSTIPNVMSFETEDFTVEAWIRLNAMPTSDDWPNNFSSHMVVIAVGTPSLGDGCGLVIGATRLILQSNDAQIMSGLHGIAINNWYHIAATRSGQTLRLFVNGLLKASRNLVGPLGTGSNTFIGSETGQGAWLNGFMQDLRVTRGLCRYTADFAPPVNQFTYRGGVVAIGGGAGGSSYYNYTPGPRGYDGASGGGASGYSDSQTRPGGRGLAGQGNNGGQGGGQYYSGGGGGAGGAGTNSPARPNGGPGVLNSILGVPYYWGGGGGGASYTLSTGGDGGIGGGGGGAVGTTSGGLGLNSGRPGGGGSPSPAYANRPGGDGGTNTGGGGGGGGHYNATNQGGRGGSGIVVLRYVVPPALPPSKPVYTNQEFVVGPVSLSPSVPSVDPKGLPLTYSTLDPLPASLSIDPSTGVISGNLDDIYAGFVTVSVTNGVYSTASDPFSLCKAIVQSGLITNLDAGNISSYPGTGTTWTDISGFGNNGTLVNGPVFDTSNDGNFILDGSNDYVSLPANLLIPHTGNPFSISLWFRTGSAGILLGQQNTSTPGSASSYVPGIYVDTTGKLRTSCFWGNSTSTSVSASSVATNAWFNVTVTFASSTETVYINGVFSQQRGLSQASYSSTYYYFIGNGVGNNWPNIGNTPFNGRVASFLVYNRALSGSEVTQNFDALKARFGL